MQVIRDLQEAYECLNYAEISPDEAIYITNGSEYAIGTLTSLIDFKSGGYNSNWRICDCPFNQ